MKQISFLTDDNKTSEAIGMVIDGLDEAEAKHPEFPSDPVHMAAILAEEAGEVVKATNNFYWHRGDIEEVRKELAHAGAMVLRMLLHLDQVCRKP